MAIPVNPTVIPMPIATNGDKRTIPPETTSGTNQLSYSTGFPPITSTPLSAGGIPPQREDFNAAYNLFTQHAFWNQAGLPYNWQNSLNYLVNSKVQGSNGSVYVALKGSGPEISGGSGFVGPIDPTTDTAGYWMLSSDSGGAGLRKLTEDVTNFYIGPGGNDTTGDGSSGNPWRTIQHAVNAMAENYHFVDKQAVLNIAAGTYNESVVLPKYISNGMNEGRPPAIPPIQFELRGASNTTTIIQAVEQPGPLTTSTLAGPYLISNMTLQAIPGAAVGFYGNAYSDTAFNNCIIQISADVADHLVWAHEYANVAFRGTPTIFNSTSSTMESILFADRGTIHIDCNCIFNGTVSATDGAVARAAFGGFIGRTYDTGVTINLTGTVTGKRYEGTTLAIFATQGGGANWFPGTVDGTLDGGAIYE